MGKNSGLENVVLYISQGLSAEAASQKPSTTPVFDQKGCQYTPHVIAMDVGQNYKVTTSDQTAHNIHPEPNPMTGNIPWNRSQPPGAPPIVQSWKAEEVAIPVKCNIHPWMHGYHVVVKGTLRRDGRQRFVHDRKRASRKLYRNRMAGNLRNPDAEGDGGGWPGGYRELYL